MNSQTIPVKSFYNGSTKKEYLHIVNKKRRLKREKEYIDRPLANIKKYNSCFTERRVWKWFHRQQDAIEYCQCVKEKSVCLFAYEKHDGKRSYLVTTRKQFWEQYDKMDARKKHFYEVILEDHVCRLYFDIEYKYEHNKELDNTAVLETFVNYVCYCIEREFDVLCSEKHVIDLSSSTNQKFSRHLIFNHPKLLFSNNVQCGDFVKEICFSLRSFIMTGIHNKYLPIEIPACGAKQKFKSEILSMKRLQDIIIKTEKNDAFLCDLCVYTKNRNFRLYLSSKHSKYVPLELSTENKFFFKTKPTQQEKFLRYQMRNITFDANFERFADTLVCPTEYNEEVIINIESNSSNTVTGKKSKRGE